MKYHLFFLIILTGIFFGVGYLDRFLMIQGREPLLNMSQDILKDGKTTRYRSPIYEAEVSSKKVFWEETEDPEGIGDTQFTSISLVWEWKLLNFLIWLVLGLILHKILKRIPKGTVA